MPTFSSSVQPSSDAFRANREDMLALVERLRELELRAVATSEKRKPRFRQRNQLTPRERLSHLLDPGMPFLELMSLANFKVDDPDPEKSIPGASLITGIGYVSGVRCAVWIDDSGIKAGAFTQTSLPKCLRIMDLALRHKLPLIHCVESAGADLMQYKVAGWAKGGGLFYNLAKLSAAGIPTFAVLHGPSTAGGAYMPGMSDTVIGVKNNGLAALGGAALVRAATGEVANDADLGGAEMHASVSGLVEYLAEDDAHALQMCREAVARLGWNENAASAPERSFDEPLLDTGELAGTVPVDYRQAYDVREVLARIVDGSQFTEVKPRYGAPTVCATASVAGYPCAFLGNNGPIDPNGAAKVGHFLQTCEKANLPVVFLNNTTGYMVGTEYEQAGMIKHGSKMIQAVSNLTVPKITFYLGASFGAGNYGMCGLAFDPDFLFAWPNAQTGVMGGEQAARTMTQVMTIAAERRGLPVDEERLKTQEDRLIHHFDSQADAFTTAGQCLDDGVIDPRDTRKVLAFALATCWEARHRELRPTRFGIARY